MPWLRQHRWKILRLALTAAVVVAVVFAVGQRWTQVRAELDRIPPGSLLLSGLLVFAALLATLVGWRLLLAGLGSTLPWRPAAGVFFIGQLGKYLPGSVWTIVVQAEGARRCGVPRERTAIAGLLAVLLSAWSGVAVGLGAVPILFSAGIIAETRGLSWLAKLPQTALLLGLAALLLLCGHPRVVNAGVGWGLRLLRRPALAEPLPARVIAATLVTFAGAWLLLGAHAWVLAAALDPGTGTAGTLARAAILGYPLAAAVGILVIPLPVGLGLREFMLVLLLTGPLTEPAAIATGLVSRFVVTIADIAVALLGWLVGREAIGLRPRAQTSADTSQ